ncbi:MAG TPA: TonB-dependent receptor [Bacteroidales bacterium]|nr:TonB-dependent receptor [Bacteroidales bacterium]HRX97714.1 TonB-dependent receptor [Bacteroidales bacterium]
MKIKQYPFQFIFFAFLFTILTGTLIGQNGTIRGFVYEKETGEPVIFTNVYLRGTTYGSATDVNGYFAISQIPPGKYILTVTFLGFDTLQESVTVNPNEIISKKLFLEKGSYNLEEVEISAEREEARTETRTSVVKITPKQIKQIPSLGGTPDLAQYLQVLPGVVFTGDQGGQLYIRGGSPIQNKVLLDGMIVYNPFHSIGLFSVFDTDIIRNADIYTGGFGAEYGGRISSVMDITTRDGNKTRMAGKVGASTFGANMMIEGPIKKLKEGGSGSSSFILSAKNSYLEQSSKIFYDYVDTAGLPFNYTDIYGKISLLGDNGSKINFFGFNFNDQVNNYKALSDYKWESYGGGANFLIIPGQSPVLMEGHLAYSQYKISLDEENNLPRESSINGFNMGFDFTYFIGKDEIKYGFEILGFKTDYIFYNSIGIEISQEENTTEIGGYVKYKKTIHKFLLEPSFRLHYYASLGNMSLEPRLAMKYNVADDFRIKFAGGFYSQNLISARSDRDVVNLFYGFLSGPDNLPEEYNGEPITHKLQKAEHAILGFEYDLSSHVTMNLEGYYKNFSQLTNINRNKLLDENDYPNEPDLITKDFIIERGYATGVDMTMKYETHRLYLWFVYSLGYVVREYEDITGSVVSYNPHYDRRHNVNLVGTYMLGDKRDWELNARWNFGSGFPFTLTQGYYGLITFQNGIYTDYTTDNEELGILYGDLNTGRLPYYHRLDIGLKKTFVLGYNTKLEANVSITNVYNRENIFYTDRITGDKIYQLPIMPSAGLNFTF